jgi:hypothetical protein
MNTLKSKVRLCHIGKVRSTKGFDSVQILAFPAAVRLISPSNRSFHSNPPALSKLSEDVLRSRLNDFQDLFVEARLCIEDAQDSVETTYYDEDADAAKEAVEEAVKCFEDLIADMPDLEQKNSVLRSNGLKVEQLKGEVRTDNSEEVLR